MMNNSWQEKLEMISNSLQIKEEKDFAINTTGATVKDDTPDRLFYHEFSEEDAMHFRNIFSNFKASFNEHFAENCAKKLYDELSDALKSMDDRGLELMLYSSRIIREIIEKYEVVRNELIALTERNLISKKTLEYIASGWEWSSQLRIVIEACGRMNDEDYIKILMDNYQRIINLFSDTQPAVIKSYMNMLLASQNDKTVEHLVTIVCSSAFIENMANHELLKNPLKNSNFMKSEDNYNTFMESAQRNIPNRFSGFKDRFNRILKKDKKAYNGNWEFGMKAPETLKYFRELRDKNMIKKGIDKVIANIDNIPQEIEKSNAYHTLGQKTYDANDPEYKSNVIHFLTEQLGKNPEFTVGIKLGLVWLETNYRDKNSTKEYMMPIFDVILNETETTGRDTLSKFFRRKKDCFPMLIEYLQNYTSKADQVSEIANYVDILQQMCKSYSYNFGQDNYSASNVLDLIKYIIINYPQIGSPIMKSCIDTVGVLLDYSPQNRQFVLDILSLIRTKVEQSDNLKGLMRDVDKLIEKGDEIVAPE